MSDIDHLEGLHVGLLTRRELDLFNKLCAEGKATRSYDSVPGLYFGMAKVRILRPEDQP